LRDYEAGYDEKDIDAKITTCNAAYVGVE